MTFFELHDALPREGPGNDASTERALRLLPDLPPHPAVLDIGCGPGAQTLALARATSGTITAVDRHQPFLDELQRRAKAARLTDRIQAINGSMDALPFEPESFDVIWSEGAIYIIGFEKGLRTWQPLVRRSGYVVVTELTWLTDDPPEPARKFWNEAYPEMRTTAENRTIIERCGYEHLADFPLSKSAWRTDYYDPLEQRIADLRKRYANDQKTLDWLATEQQEIDIFKEHGESYGYVFYLMRRR